MKSIKFLLWAASAAVMLASCATKTEPGPIVNPGVNPGGGDTPSPSDPVVEAKLNTTWTVDYNGRKKTDGSIIEEIVVNNVPLSQSFLVSVINKENYSTYSGDILAFLKNELEYNSDYVYVGAPQIIQFGMFRHGTWYAFVIGITSDKKLTGEYAYKKFTVEEEEPSEDYLKWIGGWTVSDKYLSYDLTISQSEANYAYRVDGWEVRNGVGDWNQMNQEYIETFYEPSDGNMYFVSQYVQSYNDEDMNGTLVDQIFIGQIDYDGISEEMGLYIIPDEGLDLAYAQMIKEGETAGVYPCKVTAPVGSDVFDGFFYGMQYAYTDGQSWYLYNQDIAALPMNMKRESVLTPMANLHRSGKLITKDKPRRGKVYQKKSNVAKSAVKVN